MSHRTFPEPNTPRPTPPPGPSPIAMNPMAGYIELPIGITDKAADETVRAFRDWANRGHSGPLVLMHGARYVPWSAWEPRAVLSSPIEAPSIGPWWAAAVVMNAVATLLVALAVTLR